jgi:hypothetical protein
VLDTAGAYGLRVDGPAVGPVAGRALAADPPTLDPTRIEAIVATLLPLSYALTAVGRSLGEGDLYPFVLPPPVVDKLGFVHRVIRQAAAGALGGDAPGGPVA